MDSLRDRCAIVVGLDGVSLSIFKALISKGVMPYLHNLSYRALESSAKVMVPYTAPSWTSIATGVNPGKHNVYDFVKPCVDGSIRMISVSDVMYPRINEILSFNKVPSIISTVPYTYPPTPKYEENIVIGSWTRSKVMIWPHDVYLKLRNEIPAIPALNAKSIGEFVERIHQHLEHKLSIELSLAEKYPWRLFFIMIPHTDWIFHYAYDLVLGGRKDSHILKIFELIDRFVRRIVELSPGEPLIILVSDHGFTEASISININVLLEKVGLLSLISDKNIFKNITLE